MSGAATSASTSPNGLVRDAWAFLLPYVRHAAVSVFSREEFVWEGIDRDRVEIIPPTIDAFTPKNQDLEPETVLAILRASGLVADGGSAAAPVFRRPDGTPGRVERHAQIVRGRAPPADDAARRPGLALGRAQGPGRGDSRLRRARAAETGAHLVYAGPAVEAVADDPEGAQMLREAIAARSRLPAEARRRVHLATLPMDDLDENAVIVNALQRHAFVVVQKSLAEGFGLTVAEAMWKGRPVVASKVGGIRDQIAHGESGILLDDPHDLQAFGAAITDLLADPRQAERLGRRGTRTRARPLPERAQPARLPRPDPAHPGCPLRRVGLRVASVRSA